MDLLDIWWRTLLTDALYMNARLDEDALGYTVPPAGVEDVEYLCQYLTMPAVYHKY